MTVERHDPRAVGPAELAGAQAVLAACIPHDLPGDPVPPPEDLAARLRATSAEGRLLLWLARENGEVSGFGRMFVPDIQNTRIGYLDLAVHPERRRRGHGRALLAAATDALRAEGRDTVHIEAVENSASAAFCERFGITAKHREVESLLDLSTADRTFVEAVSAEDHPGYRIRNWSGLTPGDVLDSYTAAANAMHDAPHGDMDYEPFVRTPQRVRDKESWVDQCGRDAMVTVAVHEPSGEVAAVTVLLVPRWPTARAFQGDTAVVRAHRGHGLGLWIKATMLGRLRAEYPQIREIVTGNAEDNVHMRRINTRLGFRPVRVWEEREGKL